MILCYLWYWLFSTVFGGIIFFRSGSERVNIMTVIHRQNPKKLLVQEQQKGCEQCDQKLERLEQQN